MSVKVSCNVVIHLLPFVVSNEPNIWVDRIQGGKVLPVRDHLLKGCEKLLDVTEGVVVYVHSRELFECLVGLLMLETSSPDTVALCWSK